MVHSFSTTSFSTISFATRDYVDVPVKGHSRNRNKFRDYMARLARDFARIFRPRVKQEEPQPLPPLSQTLPPIQPPKTVTILAKEPETIQEAEQIITLNDKWVKPVDSPSPLSFVASVPAVEYKPKPVIKHEEYANPLLQKKTEFTPYLVAEGQHIESHFQQQRKPRPAISSKAASVLLQLLIMDAVLSDNSADE